MFDFSRRCVAIVEMVGGALGLIVCFNKLSSLSGEVLYNLFPYILVAIVFALTSVSGYLLYKDNELGYRLSIYSNLIQIPIIKTTTASFFIASGAFIPITWVSDVTGSSLGFTIRSGSHMMFEFLIPVNQTEFGINLVALFIVFFLIKRMPK